MLNTINRQEVKSGNCSFAVVLVFIPAVVLAASMGTGVEWFKPGDLEWREAMASHGLLIPAWMLLALFSLERFGSAASAKWTRVAGWMAVVAALLTGAGALLVRGEGFSGGAVLQGFGMFLADLVGLVSLATLVLDRFRGSGTGFDGIACWTLIASFAALSLATPLGHLAAEKTRQARLDRLVANSRSDSRPAGNAGASDFVSILRVVRLGTANAVRPRA